MPLRFTSLRARLLILAIIAVVPVLLLAVRSFDALRLSAAAQGEAEAVQLIRLAANDQNLLVESTHQLLAVLAQLPAVRDHETVPCSGLLSDLLKAYPEYANMGLVGLDGNALCSAKPLGDQVGSANRTWFRQAILARDFVVGDSQLGSDPGALTLNFGYPVLDEDGQPVSVLFAALDLNWLNGSVSKVRLPLNSTLTMIDRDGTILARSPHEGIWSRQTIQDLSVLSVVQKQAEGTVQITGADGEARLYVFKRLEATPQGDLSLNISIPTPVAFAAVASTLSSGLASLGLVVALAAAATWLGGSVFIVRPVRAVLGATRQLSAGDLSARTGVHHGAGELGQLARAFDDMAADLEQREDQFRSLLAKSIHIQDEERARIARDMHDGVLQLITAARFELQAAKLAAELGSPSISQEKFKNARQVLDDMEMAIRHVIYDLHPSILDGRGLVPALRRYVVSFRELSGVFCRVQVHGAPIRLRSPVELAVFRMVVEALQNVAVHAKAREASVTLDYKGDMLAVSVQDDGKGFDLHELLALRNGDHLGLISIQERGESLGGRMELRSEPGRGTKVTFWVPFPADEVGDGIPVLPSQP